LTDDQFKKLVLLVDLYATCGKVATRFQRLVETRGLDAALEKLKDATNMPPKGMERILAYVKDVHGVG
jgi:hypothetical protein